MDERRKYERVGISSEGWVTVTDESGKTAGMVRQLSRGGMMIEPWRTFKVGEEPRLVLSDRSENTRFTIACKVLHATGKRVGCVFAEVDPDSAEKLGTLIGKYYSGTDEPGH